MVRVFRIEPALVHGGRGAAVALGLALFLLASCRPPAPDEVRIGVILPLSGPLHETEGQPMQHAARLAAARVNDAGGLTAGTEKLRVKLVFEDSEDSPEGAVRAARRLINQQGVAALVGPVLSRNALAAASVAESLRVPMISPTATHPEVTEDKRYVFRVAFTDDLQGRVMARLAREVLAAEKAAVLYDVASPYNRRIAEVFARFFEQGLGHVVAFESYTTGEQDFRAILARIRDAAPDVLVLPNYSPEVALQAEQARELGIAATLLGGDAWDADGFARRRSFDGSFLTDHWHPELDTRGTPQFVESFRARHRRLPSSGAALTYDALGLLFRVVEAEGSLDGESLRRGLAAVEGYQGLTGTISFVGDGDPIKSVVIVEIRGGEARFYRQIEP